MAGLYKSLRMFKRSTLPHHLKFQDTNLFLALMLWLCTLPLVALIAYPFLGWKVTLYLAGFLLVADLVACWFLCTFRIPQKPIGGKLWRGGSLNG